MSSNLILLVEDNPDDEALALRALRKTAVPSQVVVARDGVEALDYLFGKGKHEGRDTREQPCLILLDLKLPKMTGFEVLKELRSHSETRLIPVVVLTSSKEDRDLVESYDKGANSYIRKPIDFMEFREKIRHVSEYWLGTNLAPPVDGGGS